MAPSGVTLIELIIIMTDGTKPKASMPPSIISNLERNASLRVDRALIKTGPKIFPNGIKSPNNDINNIQRRSFIIFELIFRIGNVYLKRQTITPDWSRSESTRTEKRERREALTQLRRTEALADAGPLPPS